MKISTNVRLLKNYRQRVWAVSCMAVMMLLASLVTNAQYNTATVNGTIAGGEYGTHTDGQNQNTNGGFATLMTWDNTNLYLAISAGSGNNSGEGIVLYLDKDNLTPIDGGTAASNGTNVGNAYDGTNFAQLPFRADLVVYVKDSYNEYRTPNGSNGWNTQVSNTLSYSSTNGTVMEVAIPWSVIGGRPGSFNFFSYKTSGGGFVYAQQPTPNAGGTIGTSARYSYYYTVSSTTDGSSTKPFSRMSYVFNSTTSVTNFGSIGVWDFTMNSGGGGTSITRTAGAGGVWTISGNLVVASGTIDFGTSTNAANVGNVVMSGGALTLSSGGTGGGDLNVSGNFTKTGGTFTCNNRAVGFNGTTKQIFSSNATENINFLSVSNTTDSVVLASNVNIPTPASSLTTLTINNNAKLGIRPGATLTTNSTTVLGNTNFAGTGSRVNVEGTLRMVGTTAQASFNSTATTLVVGATGTLDYAYTWAATTLATSPVLPLATWNAGSTMLISGLTSPNAGTWFGASSNITQSFSNFTWNCTGQTTSPNMGGGTITATGTFTLASTGSAELRLGGATNGTITCGNFTQTGGTLNFASGAGAGTLNVSGTFNQTAGTLTESSTGNGKIVLNAPGTNAVQNVTASGTISNEINWQVGTGSLTNTAALQSNIAIGNAAATFSVLAGSAVDLGSSRVISGTGTFSLASGARLITANNGGVNSSVTTTTRTLNAAANYTFNGGSGQVTGAAVTSAANINIDNSAGVSLSSNTAITGTLTFTNGRLITNAKTLTLSNTPSGASTSRYIVADATGTVTMNAVTTAKTLPIGVSGSYAPITITAPSSTNYTAYVTNTLPCTPSTPSKVVNLAWVLTGSTAPSSVGFQWNSGDQGGSFTNNGTMELGRYNAACPYNVTTLGAAAGNDPNTVTASSGFATGTNTYVLANQNSLVLAAPTVTTTVAASAITDISATSGGQGITGNSLDSVGLVWSVSPTTPAVGSGNYAGRTNEGTSSSNFSSNLTGLSAQTQYNVRAYASNAAGTGYGNQVSFYTLSTPVTTQASGLSASPVSSTQIDLGWTGASFPGSGATVKGYVLLRATSPNTPSLGNGNGAAPSAGANTTIVSSTIADNATTFSNNSGLIANTTYNYLLVPFTWDGTNAATYNYLTGSAPTASATTNGGAPSIASTTAISSITENSASSGGSTLTDGGSSITSKGVVWDVTTGPTTGSNAGSTNDGTGTADFSSSLTSLNPQTQYYVRAYASNGLDAYANELNFYTLSNPATAQASSFSATPNGSGTIDLSWTGATFPGSGATQAGYVLLYAASPNTPSLGNGNGAAPSAGANTTLVSTSATNLPTTPATTSSVNGLTGGVVYNFLLVPYTWDGTNNATYNYLTSGAPTANATAVTTPSVTTVTASSISTSGASSGGNAVSDGGGTISAKGVVWDVTANPTIGSNLGSTNDGTGTTSYSSSISGLSPETQYNYRAYVTNNVGTAYGSNLTFRTLSNEPTAQASGLSATPTSSTNINLGWTAATFAGSGATASGYVLLRATNPNTPSLGNGDGAAPTAGANTTIISSSIGSGATSTSDATASAATTYNYLLVPYSWDGTNAATYNYLTTAAPTASATTLAAAPLNSPTSITFSAVTASTITTGWTAATGSPAAAGYIVVRGAGVTPNTDPVPGTTYTAGNTLGNATVAFVGAGTSTGAQTGLNDATTYNYKIYSYSGSGASINYKLTSPLTGSQATSNIGAPTATAATSVTSGSFTANWNAVSGASSYQLDVFPLQTESFEGSSMALFSVSSGTGAYYSGNSGGSDGPASSPFTNAGTGSFGISNGSVSIMSSDINTTSLASPQLSFKLASFSIGSTGNGADAGDIVTVEISPDGGLNYYSTVRVLGFSNAYWAYTASGSASTAYDGNATPVDFQPAGGGNRTSDGYSTVTVTGLPSSANMRIRITLLNNAANERWVIDNLSITPAAANLAGYNSLSVSGTTQSVTGLTANTAYGYRVRTVGVNSTSANSNTIGVMTPYDINFADFRSKANGNWSDPATWEYLQTGVTWVTATQAPGSGNNVTVLAAHTVTLDQAHTVGSGKTVTVSGTLNTGSNVIDGAGTFTLASAATLGIGSIEGISSSGATGNVQTTTRNFSTAANYVYNTSVASTQETGSGLPATVNTLTINHGSSLTILLTNSVSITSATNSLRILAGEITLNGNTLSIPNNGTIDCTGGAFSPSGPGTVAFLGAGTVTGGGPNNYFPNVTIAGGVDFGNNLSLITQSLQVNTGGFCANNSPKYSGGATLIYNTGQNAATGYGTFNEWPTTTGPTNVSIIGNTTVRLQGDYSLAGNLSIEAGSGLRSSSGLKTITMTGGTTGSPKTITNSGSMYGEYAGNTLALTFNGVTQIAGTTGYLDAKTYTINGTLICGNQGLNSNSASPAAGQVIVNSGGTLSTTNVNGLWDGSTLNPTIRFNGSAMSAPSLNSNSTIDYNNATGGQTVSALTYGNLKFSNTSGNNTLAGNASAVTVDLGASTVTTNANTLSVTSNATGSVSRTTGYVIGNLNRAINTGTNSYAYAIGTSGGYTPATISLNGVTTGGSITAVTLNGVSANYPATLSATDRLARHWTITNNGVAGFTADVQFDYLGGDLTGAATSSSIKAYKFDGPSTVSYPTYTTGSNTFTVTGLSSFNEFGAGNCDVSSIASVTGTSPLCVGSSATYSANSVVLGSGTGAWSSSDNGIATVDNSGLVSAISSGTATITYTISGGCSPTVSASQDVTVNPNLPVSVSISANPGNTICAGTSVTFTATPTNGGGSPAYQWYNGVNPISGETASTYTSSSLVNGDQISVQLTSSEACTTGNPASSNTISMTVNPNQPVSVSISASPGSTVCAGTSVTFLALPTNEGSTPSYQWYLNNTPVGTDANSYTLTSPASGDQVYVVLTSNITPCATGNPATSNTVTMTVNQPVAVPGPITGPSDVCQYTNTNVPITYSIDPVAGAASYQWTLPTRGATLVGSGTGTSISVLIDNSFAATNQQFKVRTVSPDGCLSASSNIIVTKTLPGIPAQIFGPTDVCPYTGGAPVTYSIAPVAGATSYLWQVGTGITLIGANNGTSIQVQFASNFTSAGIRVTAISNCGSRAPRSLTVERFLPAAPTAITGPTNACAYVGNNTQATYSIDPVANATSYLWTPSAGITIVGANNGTSVNVTFASGFTTGTLRARSVANCGNSADRILTIGVGLPTTPVLTAGPLNGCPYVGTNTQVTYTVSPVAGASSYQWTIPANVTVISGLNTNSITVTFGNAYSTSNFAVRAVGACGSSSDLIFSVTASSATIPGTITGPTNACLYIGTANVATYTIRKVNGAISYNWLAPAGATITGHPAGTGVNDTTITVTFDNSFVSGTAITVQSVNCNYSTARGLVIYRNAPAQPGLISGPTNVCPFMVSASNPSGTVVQYTTFKVASALSYNWVAPANATITAHPGGTGINDTIVEVVFNSNFVSGFLQVTASNSCGAGATRSLSLSRLRPGTPSVIDVVQNATCPNRQYTYSLSAMPSNATYVNWTVPTGGTIQSGQGTASITVTYTGGAIIGSVTATATNNCGTSSTRSLSVLLPACPPEFAPKVTEQGKGQSTVTGTADQLGVDVFPNPTVSDFKIRLTSTDRNKLARVRVLDLQGRELLRMNLMPEGLTSFGSQLKPGTYLVEVVQGTLRTVQKLIKL